MCFARTFRSIGASITRENAFARDPLDEDFYAPKAAI